MTRRSGRVRQWFTAAGSLVAVAGALGILIGLSEVRTSYLAQSGVDAHASQFLLIQLGIATAAVVLSWWMAHPYDQRWRSAQRHAIKSTANLARAYQVFAGLVSGFNGLVQRRSAVLNQHSDWSAATVTDAARKGEMYGRRVLLAQPEPTTDALLPSDLPVPATPSLIAEVAKHQAGKDSLFKRYVPCDTATVEARLADLDRRRAERLAAFVTPRHRQTPPRARKPTARSPKRGARK